MNSKVFLRLTYYSDLFKIHSVQVLFDEIMKKYGISDLGNDYKKTESHKEIDLLFSDDKTGKLIFNGDRAYIYISSQNELTEINFTSACDVSLRQIIYANGMYIVLKNYIKYDFLKLNDKKKTITEYNMEASKFDGIRYYEAKNIEDFRKIYDDDFFCVQDQAIYHGVYESKLCNDLTSFRFKDSNNKNIHGVMNNSDLVSSLDHFFKDYGPESIFKIRNRDNK